MWCVFDLRDLRVVVPEMSDTCHQVHFQPNEYLVVCPFVGICDKRW